jgi:DNA-binding XRE family transcriptional regulator
MAESPRPYEIVNLRRKHKISQATLADSLYGVRRSKLSDWETGKHKCPPMAWWAMVLTWDKRDLWEEERALERNTTQSRTKK